MPLFLRQSPSFPRFDLDYANPKLLHFLQYNRYAVRTLSLALFSATLLLLSH